MCSESVTHKTVREIYRNVYMCSESVTHKTEIYRNVYMCIILIVNL